MKFIIPFITATFAFGTAIFYCLSCVEKSVLKLAFSKDKTSVTEDNIRFTHKALKRLAPLLPPANSVLPFLLSHSRNKKLNPTIQYLITNFSL